MILTCIFLVILFSVLGSLIKLALTCTWAITKVLFYIIFSPLILLVLFFSGFTYLAIIGLVIFGLGSLIRRAF